MTDENEIVVDDNEPTAQVREYKYYTLGSRSEKEGLTLMTALYLNGEPAISYPMDDMYKVAEITEEDYAVLTEEFKNPPMGRLGIAGGLINEDGLAEIEALNTSILEAQDAMNLEKATMLYAKFKKLEELEISTIQDEITLAAISGGVLSHMEQLIADDTSSGDDE